MKRKITENKICLTLDEIRDYKEKNLSEEKIRKVEEHLIDCELCSDLLEGYTLTSNSEISEVEKEINNKIDTKIKQKNRWQTIIYSSAAIFVLFSLSVLLNNNGKKSEEIFKNYFKPYPDVSLQMRGNTSSNNFKKGMQLYNNQKYDEAVDYFRKLQDNNEYARFYSGISLIAEGKLTKGISFLQDIASNKNAYFYPEANWYIGLALLKMEKPIDALNKFELIKDHPDYKLQISKIRRELDANN